ncbi:MAG: pyridoxamine 5'-phosphate oxidase family protein [Dehalococcoidales bacterium]|nr:MAG: pyridoxamine 5'-phosphate oxidase family protein [Dehalococcoidales bacterium]
MTKEEIFEIIKANPIAWMATVEGNQPRVRAMGIPKADENGIIIQTWTIKDIHQQVVDNPKMELCFNDLKGGIQVRVSGAAEIINDVDAKEKMVEDRPFMKPTVEEHGIDVVALYRLKGRATVWTRDKNFDPKEYIDL